MKKIRDITSLDEKRALVKLYYEQYYPDKLRDDLLPRTIEWLYEEMQKMKITTMEYYYAKPWDPNEVIDLDQRKALKKNLESEQKAPELSQS